MGRLYHGLGSLVIATLCIASAGCSEERVSKDLAGREKQGPGVPGAVVAKEPAPVQSEEAQLREALTQGKELANQDKVEEAIPYLEKAVVLGERVYGRDHPSTAPLLKSLAELYEAMEQYAQAEPLLRRNFQIREAQLGPDGPDADGQLSRALQRLAQECVGAGQYEHAESIYRRCQGALLTFGGLQTAQDGRSAFLSKSMGDIRVETGNYKEAATLYLRRKQFSGIPYESRMSDVNRLYNDIDIDLLIIKLIIQNGYYSSSLKKYLCLLNRIKIIETKYGRSTLKANSNYYSFKSQLICALGALYCEMGQYADAETLYRDSMDLLDSPHNNTGHRLAVFLRNLGFLYRKMAKYPEAEKIFGDLIHSSNPKIVKIKNNSVFSSSSFFELNELAQICQETGRHQEADVFFQCSLKCLGRVGRPANTELASSLNSVASYFQAIGQYPQAEPLFRRSLRIYEAKLVPQNPLVATGLSNLARLYQAMGRYDQAEPLYQRSLEIRLARLGPDHPETALGLIRLASLYQATGRYDQAEPLYAKCLPILEAKLPPVHPELAAALNDQARIYQAKGQLDRAEALYRGCLRVREEQFGPDHPTVAQILDDLTSLYRTKGQNDKLELMLKRSLTIREKTLGVDHPDVARSLDSLAILYRELVKFDDSEGFFKRALEIRSAKLGPDHPDVAQTLDGMATLHALQGRWTEAAADTDRARHILRNHVGRVLPALADAEQLAFLDARDRPSFHAALSLTRTRPNDPLAAKLSAGWVLNGKAVAQQALAQRGLEARDTGDSGAGAIARQLASVRNQMAALSLATPTTKQAASRRQELATLTERERTLARNLGQALGRSDRADSWVELGEVRKALPADAVLIEIARYRPYHIYAKTVDTQWKAPRYAAWIIPPATRGEVRAIDLGDADSVEQAIALVRKAVQPDPEALRSGGEPAAEREAGKALNVLAERILKPLLPVIGPARRWIISPDAGLWLVPWAALPLPGAGYAIETHQVSYILSGRDLVGTITMAKYQLSRPLVMADPDFDKGATPDSAENPTVFQDKPTPRGATATDNQGKSDAVELPLAPRLPGTAAEAQAILPALQRYTKAEPTVYLDQQASEAIFKAAKRPQVVVLSTHGFFLDEPAAPVSVASEARGGGGQRDPAASNALLRCGLLLTGANRHRQMRVYGGEDGVLTGLEIVGTDLRGTELVVLSACETGLGQLQNGEGVAGLRQAFQLAGARSVVATLWQVPDKDSARLMTAFFEGLASGKAKAEALREAQLKQIQSRRARYGAAHPYYWAAFTITGRGDSGGLSGHDHEAAGQRTSR